MMGVLLLLALSSMTTFPSHASDYSCEIMAIKGLAYVTPTDSTRRQARLGDILRTGDFLETETNSQVDLAFDRDWNNITRVSESSQLKIRCMLPTNISLDRGEIFSKLAKLPTGSTFSIQTPTAVAAARGTEFLTSVSGEGQTSVVGFEHSVDVFNIDANGNLGEHVTIGESQKTVVPRNAPPSSPAPAPSTDMQKISRQSSEIGSQVKEAIREGRLGKIQSSATMEAAVQSEANTTYERSAVKKGEGTRGDLCLSNPSVCAGGVYGTPHHADGSACTDQNPC